jgi:hypothetical protein
MQQKDYPESKAKQSTNARESVHDDCWAVNVIAIGANYEAAEDYMTDAQKKRSRTFD